jgi:predicted DNA-binding protein
MVCKMPELGLMQSLESSEQVSSNQPEEDKAKPRQVTLTTTIAAEMKIRLKALSTLLNRNQGQIIAEALISYINRDLTREQRDAVEGLVRISVE